MGGESGFTPPEATKEFTNRQPEGQETVVEQTSEQAEGAGEEMGAGQEQGEEVKMTSEEAKNYIKERTRDINVLIDNFEGAKEHILGLGILSEGEINEAVKDNLIDALSKCRFESGRIYLSQFLKLSNFAAEQSIVSKEELYDMADKLDF